VAVSAEFRDHVTDLFASFGKVKIKLMFGGAGIYFNEQMFGLIADERIYLKASDETRPSFEREGSKPFVFESKRGDPACSMTPTNWRHGRGGPTKWRSKAARRGRLLASRRCRGICLL
jgi:DNA transformation protein